MPAKGKDADFFRLAAQLYESNESWHKAIACWEQVKKFNPNDQDANRKINALVGSATIKRAEPTLEAIEARQRRGEEPRAMQAKLDRLKQEQLTPEQR